MARGVAFQLVESLGVLERQKVAEEVKGLDQPSRATLRKYGVRFGAYHIYLPLLLKPAPRALATQLWALKHESPDAKGVSELLHLAASGRTSIPIDKDTPKSLYRTAGYRVCGDRAVRVDILERLADLIRPALAWREGVQTPKPDGAFDGRGFTVTGAMTSLTGASGEDFASILRSLGYRMDRRPKPVTPPETKPADTAETPPAASEAETAATEAAAISSEAPAVTDTAADAAIAEAPVEEPATEAPTEVVAEPPKPAGPISSLSLLPPEPDLIPQPPAPAAEPVIITPEAVPDAPAEPAIVAIETAAVPEPAVAADTAPAVAETAQAETEAKPAEPDMIEVWRPGGRSERRPHKPRRPHHAQQASAPAAAPAGETAVAADAAAAAPVEQAPRHERPQHKDRQERQDRHERQQRIERQSKSFGQRGERQGGGPARGDRPRRDKGNQVDRAEREQYYAKSFSGARSNKEPDPNSPFAKLAALKAQLEQNNKERP